MTETPVVTVPVTIDVPKEMKDVVDLTSKIVEDVKAGKSAAEIAADVLPLLISAFDGYQKLDDELKSQHKSDLVAYAVKKHMAALGL
jgi:hypothetical protein